MDPQLSFPGGRTKTQHAESDRNRRGACCCGGVKNNKEPPLSLLNKCELNAWLCFCWFLSRDTAGQQREKGCVFKQLFSKMELAEWEPIRERLWRLPLLCGLEPTPHCTPRIRHLGFFFFFFFFRMIHCSFHVTAALFSRTSNHQTPQLMRFPCREPPQMFLMFIFLGCLFYLHRAGPYDVVVEGKPTC